MQSKKKGSVVECNNAQRFHNDEILNANVDILITAAIPDRIQLNDVSKIKAKLIVEGSNIPATYEIEQMLHKKGIWVVPDFVANAGGVISSYIEYIGGAEKDVFERIDNTIPKNTQLVFERAKLENKFPRQVALEIAKEIVLAKK